MGPRGGVVTQRSAKPFTPVQFWSWPPSIKSRLCLRYSNREQRLGWAMPYACGWDAGIPDDTAARPPRRLLKRPNLTEDGCIENRERRSHAHKNGQASARPSPHTQRLRNMRRLAGGVPSVRKRNQWPSLRIVVGCAQWHVGGRQVGHHRVLSGDRRNGRPHHVQQVLELNFTHRDLRMGAHGRKILFVPD